MKKFMLLAAMTVVLPFTSNAQDDDLYFVPKKTTVVKKTDLRADDYNPVSQYYDVQPDSDIIAFDGIQGVYPDSIDASKDIDMSWKDYAQKYNDENGDDYNYSRLLDRWYGCYDPWFYGPGYWGYRHGWYSPYYSWYDPWYDPWMFGYAGYWNYYDPWFYGGYYGWYYPGYMYSWYDPWYYGGYYGGYWGGLWGYNHGWGGGHAGGDFAFNRHDRVGHNGSAQLGSRGVASSTFGVGRRAGTGSAQLGSRAQSRGYSQSAQGTGSYNAGTSSQRQVVSTNSGVGRRDSGNSSNYSSSSSYGSSSSYSRSSSSGFSGSRGGGFSGGGGSHSGGGFSGGGGGGGSHGGGGGRR